MYSLLSCTSIASCYASNVAECVCRSLFGYRRVPLRQVCLAASQAARYSVSDSPGHTITTDVPHAFPYLALLQICKVYIITRKLLFLWKTQKPSQCFLPTKSKSVTVITLEQSSNTGKCLCCIETTLVTDALYTTPAHLYFYFVISMMSLIFVLISSPCSKFSNLLWPLYDSFGIS